MASPSTIKILEVCRVAPPEPATQISFPLTFFDIYWLRFPGNQRIFFYDISPASSSFSHLVLPKLKHSLSLALQHFLPLAGNLVWPASDSSKPFIRIDEDAAISLTIAETNADFHRLSGDKVRSSSESHPLVPHLPVSDAVAAVMALQVTLFPNRGFCIGTCSHHAVVDRRTYTMFMKSWASFCRLGEGSSLPTELTPTYDRTVINDPSGIEATYLDFWLNFHGPYNKSFIPIDVEPPSTTSVRATFKLRRPEISKFRELIFLRQMKQQEQSTPPRVSSFVITCAYVLICIVKSEQLIGNVDFLFPADLRSRLEPQIPPNYFGNCVGPCLVKAKAEELSVEDGMAVAAKAFREAIAALNNEPLREAEKWISLFSQHSETAKRITVAGSSQFGLYETDFGWGRPRKMEITSIDRTRAISLADGRDGDGEVEIGVVFNDDHVMEAFACLFAQGVEAARSAYSS